MPPLQWISEIYIMAELLLSKQKIGRGISFLAIPLFFLFSAFVLFIFVSKTAYSRISLQLKEIKDLSQKNEAIGAKVEDLSVIASKSFPDSETILKSFPEEDPALWMLAQIRSRSEEYSLVVSNQKITFPHLSDSDLGKTLISFYLVGDAMNINKFLLSFSSFAPISSFTKVVYMLEDTSEKGAAVDVVVYYTKLPEQFPKNDQPVKNLTPDEEKTIQILAKMESPQFTELSPNPPFEVTNPF